MVAINQLKYEIMEEIKRNWSSIEDYQGGNFGQRAFYTREQWIEQIAEWQDVDPMLDDIEWAVFRQLLDSMDDEELMSYIQANWAIGIIETTWLKVGNECYWIDPEGLTSGVNTILEIRTDDDGTLAKDTILLLTDGWGENEVFLCECYGLTDKVCPKCGKPLYVSDLCSYPYVCLECDENFDRNEAI